MVVSSKKKRNDRFGKLENAKLMSGMKRKADDRISDLHQSKRDDLVSGGSADTGDQRDTVFFLEFHAVTWRQTCLSFTLGAQFP